MLLLKGGEVVSGVDDVAVTPDSVTTDVERLRLPAVPLAGEHKRLAHVRDVLHAPMWW